MTTTIQPEGRYRIVADTSLGHRFPVGTIVRAVHRSATDPNLWWLVTEDMTTPAAHIEHTAHNLPGGARVRWADARDLGPVAFAVGDRARITTSVYASPGLQVGQTGTVTGVENSGTGQVIVSLLPDDDSRSSRGSFRFPLRYLENITTTETTTTEQEKPVSTSQQQKTAEQVQAEFDAFKAQVVEVARRYAREYEWCSVVDSALGEMGLPTWKRYLVDVTYTVAITADDEEAAERRVRYIVDGLNYSGQEDDEAFDEDAIGRQVGNVRLEG